MTRRRKAFAVFTAFLVVLSAVPTGTAAQSITGDECDPDAVDYGIALLSPATAIYNYATSDGCATQEVLDGNKEQEMQDVHANLANMNASIQGITNGNHNALENARTVAWTKAEVATLKALENNSSQAQTRRDAREAVRDYYARQQRNMIAENNRLVEQLAYLDNVSDQESLNWTTIQFWGEEPDEFSGDFLNVTLQDSNRISTHNFTLVNGSTVSVKMLETTNTLNALSPLFESEDVLSGDEDQSWATRNFTIISEYDGSRISISSQAPNEEWERIQNQSDQMLANMNSTVNGLYGSYVRGELDIEEYRSVQAAAMGWGQDLTETGYSTYAVVALAQAGESVPDLNATGSMTIESSQFQVNGTNETLTGLVVGEPTDGSDAWQVGQTYDPANSNGTVTFHVSGTNRSLEVRQPFTLVGAEGAEGQDISTVNTQQYNYRTSNFSELGNKLDLLIELRQEQQERIEEASSGGSGGAWFDWSNGQLGFGLGAGIGVVLLVVAVGGLLYVRVVTP